MTVGLIWAQSPSGVIGRAGGIPWRLPEDLARFKELTMGHTVVMGRLTWESLPGKVRPLPGRRNVVVTRQADYMADGATVVGGLDEVAADDEMWVIGGGQIYSQLMDKADKLVLTEVHKEVDGDVLFPEWNRAEWKETAREDHLPEFSFVEYERIK
jgi:dihydrofolate reductase